MIRKFYRLFVSKIRNDILKNSEELDISEKCVTISIIENGGNKNGNERNSENCR